MHPFHGKLTKAAEIAPKNSINSHDSFRSQALSSKSPKLTVQAMAKPILNNRVNSSKLQLTAMPTGPDAIQNIHQTAMEGIRGSGSSLPHFNKIQASFGHHDISGIQAYTGSAAKGATQAINAEAYAVNGKVAFNSANPTLHTAAHEAAHVVQQHAGVHLKNGIGEVGDQYERHADAVADLVVQGQSAENLLNKYSYGRSTNQSAVQMAKSHDGNPSARANSQIWYTPSGNFSKRDTTTGKLDRAGEVEAVLLPTDVPKGSTPSISILGWHWVYQFNGTAGANGSWVRFHILNEHLGGPGDDPKNLVPTTTKTNLSSNWHAKFEEPTKDALLKHAKTVHFYAKAEYYDNTTGSDPGEQHLEFFPKSIKAESSYWDSTSTSWKKIATDASAGQLDNIPPPPVNPAVIPIYLKTATKTQLDNNFKAIDDDLRGLITGDTFTSSRIENLSAASTLQNIYDAIVFGVTLDMVTRRFHGDPVDWVNRRWDDLENALKPSLATRPLQLTHGWVASGSVTKEKTQAQKEQERREAEEKAKMAEEAALKLKKQKEMQQTMEAEHNRLILEASQSAFGLPPASPAAAPSGAPIATSHLRSGHLSAASDMKSQASWSKSIDIYKIIADDSSKYLEQLLAGKFGDDKEAKSKVWGKWKNQRKSFWQTLEIMAMNSSSLSSFKEKILLETQRFFKNDLLDD